jgi:hypothetical protein
MREKKKFTPRQLQIVLAAHKAKRLRRHGFDRRTECVCFQCEHDVKLGVGCINQVVYHVPCVSQAYMKFPLAAKWFDMNYDPIWTLEKFRKELKMAELS